MIDPLLLVLLFLAVLWLMMGAASRRAARRPEPRVSDADVMGAVRAAEDVVTRVAQELQPLDLDVSLAPADAAMVQDWQRALDSYEAAKRSL